MPKRKREDQIADEESRGAKGHKQKIAAAAAASGGQAPVGMIGVPWPNNCFLCGLGES